MEKLSGSVHQQVLEWSARFRSESLSLVDYLDHRQTRKEKASSLERDLLALSPVGQLQRVFAQARRTASAGSLNLKFSLPTADLSDPAKFAEWEKSFDLVIRMMAKDDADYRRLKEQFSEMFDITREHFTSGTTAQISSESSSASGRVVASGGEFSMMHTEGHIELSFQLEQTEERFNMRQVYLQGEERSSSVQKIDPLILDLNGDGFNLTKAGSGATFDIDADGTPDQTAWVRGDDALLFADFNGNEKPDNGKELFGDQNGAAHGFAELARYDDNADKVIDNRDSIFRALRLYRDLNGDGQVQSGESVSLAQARIRSINLEFFRDGSLINGNTLLLRGSFTTEDGKTNTIADFLLGYRPGR